MSPEERRLLTDLFDRVRAAANTPRDPEAEELIARKLGEQPYAAYFLAQAVIVQDQALRATTDRVHELEDEIQRLESDSRPSRQEPGGFLGGLGSLFGSRPAQAQQDRDTYAQREGRLYDDYRRTDRDPEPAPSPWGRAGATGPWSQPSGAMPGGGFLRGALTTAAGVAGGVLVADAVRDLFSPHLGGTNTANGLTGFAGTPRQETVNNYFINDDKSDADKSSGSEHGWGGNASGNDDDRGRDDRDDSNDDNYNVADNDDGDSDDSYA